MSEDKGYEAFVSSDMQKVNVAVCAAVSLALSIAMLGQVSFGVTQTANLDALLDAEFIVALVFMGFSAAALHRTVVHPYVMFVGTCSFFLGGRLIARQLGYQADVFSDAYFGIVQLSADESVRLISLTLGCLLAIHSGYMAFWISRTNSAIDGCPPRSNERQSSLLMPGIMLLSIGLVAGVVGMIEQYEAVWGSSYLGLYHSRADFAARLVPLANYALLLAVGLISASGQRIWLAVSMLVMGLFCSAYLGLGVRSALLSFTLLAIWLFHKEVRRLNVGVVVVVPVLLIAIAQSVWAFSARSGVVGQDFEDKWSEMRKAVHVSEMRRFLHLQGISLLSIEVADRTSDYPVPAYFQTIVPGFGVMANLAGQHYVISDLYFSAHMAKQSLPEHYRKGETLGWSIVSDALVFSQKIPALFVMLSGLVGVVFAALIWKAQQNAVWFGALALVFPKLMLLPRAGIYSVIPYLEVFFVIVGSWYLLLRLLPVFTAYVHRIARHIPRRN